MKASFVITMALLATVLLWDTALAEKVGTQNGEFGNRPAAMEEYATRIGVRLFTNGREVGWCRLGMPAEELVALSFSDKALFDACFEWLAAHSPSGAAGVAERRGSGTGNTEGNRGNPREQGGV